LKLATSLKDFTKPAKAGNHPNKKSARVGYKHNRWEQNSVHSET